MLVPGRQLSAAAVAPAPASGLAHWRALAREPWVAGLALALALVLAYVAVAPPSADLAAATYRAEVFARSGFTIWDNGWYGGHNVLAYSLLAPALGAWLGVRAVLVLSALAAAALFGWLAARAFPRRAAARAAALAFAFGYCAELPSGRVPYDLGVAIGLASLCLFVASLGGRGRWRLALALMLALATSAASPVAGSFLALAAAAAVLAALCGASGEQSAGAGNRRRATTLRGGALCAAALLPLAALALAFPEGGREPFAAGAFWPELAGAAAIAAFMPRGRMARSTWLSLRIGAALYALVLVASFVISSPAGGNVVRLGALFGAPIVLGSLWGAGDLVVAGRPMRWWMIALALAPLLLYWQLATAIDDQVALAGDRAVEASFYAPLRVELLGLAAGRPLRVEVPMTGAHWEADYLPGGPISLARGWERQLDTRYAPLFYEPGLTGTAYAAWLRANAVAYVALPDARLDAAGQQEAALIRGGLPYLHEIWRSRAWRLFAVAHPAPLAQAPARLVALGTDTFAVEAPRAGSYRVAVRFSPYWAIGSGAGCVSEAPGGWTRVSTPRPGRLEIGVDFSLSRIFEHGPRCG